ncbi:L,D-transpeptidase [Nocardiopsis tropica]|uniref:Ig-like domain-containing protein n=1 Tax=Nocardiopsis tropica TaxID=109330 RepID=A0ABU7L006_9ACTN|nr:Ig-like domain-containing protein [Nocardiopsis umidischolae]MEE2054891.1 Ig-like domain-containing protein [Nocardiopsis umidischolae]
MKGRVFRPAARRLVAAAAAVVLVATACTTAGGDPGGPGGEDAPGPEITVTPGTGAAPVAPNTPVRVEASGGTITDVRVEQVAADALAEAGGGAGEAGADAEGREFPGTLSGDGTRWKSDRNLTPGASVSVYATAEDAGGEETEVVAEFHTEGVDGDSRLGLVSNYPRSGQTVGVGMPVVVGFDVPVENKAQVENSIEVTSEHPVEGAWNWVDDETAVFRPREYWEPRQKVSVDLRLAGVEASEGVYGTEDDRIDFEVGRELVSTMHVPDHELEVEIDGELVRTIPVSNGKGLERFNTTTSGTHVTMEKYAELVMDSATVGIPEGSPGHYRLDVDWAVRTSDSGEFTHAAPWNGGIGHANTSNGCTNMSVRDARWFHDQALMGDILETTGTGRELEWDNGWGFWQRSWKEWLRHSETGEPQVTDGSGTPGSVHGEGL